MKDRDPQADKKSTHLLLLAENETGYHNLLKIASAAQLEGFYYYPRIDHDFLSQHTEGIIWSSGCMTSEIPRLINQGNLEAARRQLDWYFEIFGPDHFFLELQRHNIPELEAINKTLLEMGKRYQANISQPTMYITSSKTMRIYRISCLPFKPARYSATRRGCV
jgi:DNA polymerase-3 subunit alpha